MRRPDILEEGDAKMNADPIKVPEEIVACSDNGQHPLVYISLKNGSGICQYCGQQFVRVDPGDSDSEQEAA